MSCHNDRLKTGNLTLQAATSISWGFILICGRRLRVSCAPTDAAACRPRPDASTYSALATQLGHALDKASAASPNPWPVAVHRLNRVEYTNAVRDLWGLKWRSSPLPDDSNQESFHNIASVLSVSPALLERYLSAASQVSLLRSAAARAAMKERSAFRKRWIQDQRTRDDLPHGSQGGNGDSPPTSLWTRVHREGPADDSCTTYIIGMGDPSD